MSDEFSPVGAAEAVARVWNAAGVEYLITHGLEGYPTTLGRDLDILMDQKQAPEVLRRASHTLTELGWEIIVRPPNLWGERLVALKERDGAFDYLELHTTRPLRWALIRFTQAQESADATVGPFPINRSVTFVKAVLLPLLAGDVDRFDTRYVERLGTIGITPEVVAKEARPLFRTKSGRMAARAVETKDANALVSLQPALRRAALAWMLRHPLESLRSLWDLATTKARRLWTSSAAHVEVEIPARGDAGALLGSAHSVLSTVFVAVEIDAANPRSRGLLHTYRTLSRQKAVVEWAVSQTDTVTARAVCRAAEVDEPARPMLEMAWQSGTEITLGRNLAGWIIREWAECQGDGHG